MNSVTAMLRLELEIYTQYLQISPHACPPNYFRLLGLGLDARDARLIAAAGQRQINAVRAITEAQLQPAIPQVVAKIEAAVHCLSNPTARQQYEKQLGLPATAAPATGLRPTAVTTQSPERSGIDPTLPQEAIATSASAEQPLLQRLDIDPLGLTPIAADPLGRIPTSEAQQDDDSKPLIVMASVIAGGTLLILVVLMIGTRLLSGWRGTVASTVAPAVAEITEIAATPIVPPTVTSEPSVAPASNAITPELPVPSSAPAPPTSSASSAGSPAAIASPRSTPLPLATGTPLPQPVSQPMPMPDPVPEVKHAPAAVDLPSLVSRQQQVLFEVTDGAQAELSLDTGAADIEHDWMLQRQPDREGVKVWNVVARPATEATSELVTPPSTQPLAEFVVTGDEIGFRWLGESAVDASNQLRNCVLHVAISQDDQRVQLRTPTKVEPLSITLTEKREKVELPIDAWPPTEQVFFQLLDCEGLGTAPDIKPADGRVSGQQRGAVQLPGWSRAEINYGLYFSGQSRQAIFESRFFLNNGSAELTQERVKQAFVDLQESLARDQEAAVRYQARLAAVEREASNLRNTSLPNDLAVQARALLRSQRMQQLVQEERKAITALRRLQTDIPRTQQAIVSVQQLAQMMEQWTRDTKLHWRIGANTTHGEITLFITER